LIKTIAPRGCERLGGGPDGALKTRRPFDTTADGDRAIADALSPVRRLRRLPGWHTATPFGSPAAVAAVPQSSGAGELDLARLTAWWAAHAPSPLVSRRYGSRTGEGTEENLPAAARHGARRAGLEWRPASAIVSTRSTPCSPRSAAARPRHRRTRFSFRSGPPIRRSGFAPRDALPGLRSDAADRVAGLGRPVTWPLAYLHLVAESARVALRELAAQEAGARRRRRQTLPAARRTRRAAAHAGLTPKVLAARLRVALQTGTALLRALQGRGPGGDRAGEFSAVRGVSHRVTLPSEDRLLPMRQCLPIGS
jgi:hypothetical protein